jgi:hypothetical protein
VSVLYDSSRPNNQNGKPPGGQERDCVAGGEKGTHFELVNRENMDILLIKVKFSNEKTTKLLGSGS